MRKLGIAAVVLGMLCIVPSAAFAQVKVFWTTSGMFGPFNIQGLIPSLPKEKARDITIPISMWVIDHPKGLVVFDTGNNRSEEHTSELQSRLHLVCRLLLEKKKNNSHRG